MSANGDNLAYPAVMDHKLRRIRRRQCALAVARAGLLAAAALLAAMLAAMSIDAQFILFETGARVALTGAALAVAAATLVLAAARPLLAARRLPRAAGCADEAVPQLEERWTTISRFAEQGRRPQTALGRAMLRQVTSEAVALGRLVEPALVARADGLRRPALLAAAGMAALALFLAANGRQNLVLLSRFWAPFSEITATNVKSETGDVVVPRGEAVELAAAMSGLPRSSATLFLETEEGEIEAIELTPDAERGGRLTYRVDTLEQSFRYRLQAGDSRTPWHAVTAIDRPKLADVRFTLTAPSYLRRPKYEKSYLPDRTRALAGSRLSLQLRPAASLEKLELLIARNTDDSGGSDAKADGSLKPESIALVPAADGWYRYETTLHEDVTLSPVLLGPQGLTSVDRPQCRIQVIADQAPTARVISPAEELSARPDEVVDVKFEAHDDHGVARAELVVYGEPLADGEEPPLLMSQEIPLGEQALSQHVSATAQLDLAKFKLNEGERITFAVRVADNRAAEADSEGEMPRQPSEQALDKLPESALERNSSDAPKSAMKGEVSNAAGESADAKTAGQEQKLASDKPGAPNRRQKNEDTRGADQPLAQAAQGVSRELEPDKNDAAPKAGNDVASADKTPARGPENRTESMAGATGEKARKEAGSARAETGAKTAGVKQAAGARNGDSPADDKPTAEADALSGPAPAPADGKHTPAVPSKAPVAPAGDLSQREASGKEVSRLDADKESEPTDNRGASAAASTAQAPSSPDSPGPAWRVAASDAQGQSAESNRMQLKIAATLASAEEAGEDQEPSPILFRKRIERIDGLLKEAEATFHKLTETAGEGAIAEGQINELKGADERLASVERAVAALRDETKDTPYAFAGLQMVEIGAAHVSPARDRAFAIVRQPDAGAESNLLEGLHHVSRARELLAELLVRYDRVVREQELARSLEEVAKMYEVYVAGAQRLLRGQTRPAANPLQRKMEIVEVDQEYLDRLRQVVAMRRDLMAEFGRLLGDDPRLRSKYMDLIRRRQASLRDVFTELQQRQAALAAELTAWRQVDETQREDVWALAAELRLQEVGSLAKDASLLEERTTTQLPLSLDPTRPAASLAIEQMRQVAVRARASAVAARRLMRDPFDERVDLAADLEAMEFRLGELDAAMERLASEKNDEETADYVAQRLAESRALGERLAGWSEIAAHLRQQSYAGLAQEDQQRLAGDTEQLRTSLQNADDELTGQFEGAVPPDIQAAARELDGAVEAITFNQMAAAYSLSGGDLASAEAQQALALAAFERAEELFDRLRRMIVETLDQRAARNPNVAELEDPTLDQFLSQLEREPNLNALLGIPDRPKNLKVLSDWMLWQQEGNVKTAMDDAARRARRRAEQERLARPKTESADRDDDRSDKEWRELADAEKAAAALAQKADELRRQAADPELDPTQAEKLRQAAERLEALRQSLADDRRDGGGQENKEQQRRRAEELRALFAALAEFQRAPDSQWNRVLSSLDDGLWQVRRRTPPEQYRRAIEQYQERVRKLRGWEASDATSP